MSARNVYLDTSTIVKRYIEQKGWKPQVGFEDGLQKTIDWYTANQWWWRRLVD